MSFSLNDKAISNPDIKLLNDEKFILLAGNPNVGKSTIFNSLTGLKQHTGNWSGKTVDIAFGKYTYNDKTSFIADLPGCYSIKANSSEEVCAAQAIQNINSKGIIVVCDACCLERNLNLVLQICEIYNNVVVALNFIDDAEKNGVTIDSEKLEQILSVPVVKINARKKSGLNKLIDLIEDKNNRSSFKINYGRNIENALKIIEKPLNKIYTNINSKYLSLRILEDDKTIWNYVKEKCHNNSIVISEIINARHKALNYLFEKGIFEDDIEDIIAITVIRASHNICKKTVIHKEPKAKKHTFLVDKFLTGKFCGFFVMFILLGVVFFITIKGANYPSEMLTKVLFSFEKYIFKFLINVKIPRRFVRSIVYGGYRVLAWVVSVMLPPMAIFFPLFTILEDIGYLPRIAFNLDKSFKKCNACGKQALTTCMGFGCNAAGVTGARIIDSPREKLVAIITNSFIPCNGKFPAIVSVITVFFAFASPFSAITSSVILLLFIIFAVIMSLVASKILTKTVLKGMPASFALELPPYRKPQYLQIFIRSILDRTIFVLARAAVVAFPAGIVLYVLNNTFIGQTSIIEYICNFLQPLGKLMGLDGVILTAFIFGIPANEIVLPVALMLYTSGTSLTEFNNLSYIRTILMSNGWTATTAICVILFFLMHWPCSTTLLTIKKETSSLKWTMLSFVLPTLFGFCTCTFVNTLTGLFVK